MALFPEEFISKTTPKQQFVTIRYCLGLVDAAGLREPFTDVLWLLTQKKEWIDNHSYIRQNIKEAIAIVYERGDSARTLKKLGVSRRDFNLVWKYLSLADIKKISRTQKKSIPKARIDELVNTRVLRYIKSLAHFKLRWLKYGAEWQSDHHYNPIESELLVCAFKAAYKMAHLGDEELFVNSVKRAVHNEAMNLIQRYSTAGRAELVRTKKGVTGVSHDEFSVTAARLDRTMGSPGQITQVGSSQSTLKDMQAGRNSMSELLRTIRSEMSKRVSVYIDIVMGANLHDFLPWLNDYAPHMHYDTMSDKTIQQFARLYTGVRENELKELHRFLSQPKLTG